MTVQEHLSKHDREIAAIRKLILTGMKMLTRADGHIVALADDMRKLSEDMRKLAAAQRKTEERLQGLMRSLERGRNGQG
jgi:hypothetical protein